MDDLNYCTHCWEVDVSVDDGLCSECYKAAEEARLELEKLKMMPAKNTRAEKKKESN